MKSKPSSNPHKLNQWQWWYEDRGGIVVVAEARKPDGTHITTEQVRITWAPLLEAARRCGKIK